MTPSADPFAKLVMEVGPMPHDEGKRILFGIWETVTMLPNEVMGYGLLDWGFMWNIKRAKDKADPSDRKPRILNILTMKLLQSVLICLTLCKAAAHSRAMLYFSTINKLLIPVNISAAF